MHTLFIFLFIISLAGFLAVYFRHRVEDTIALAISGMILVLYLSGLLFGGNLLPGVYICLALGGASFLYMIKSIYFERDKIKAYFLVPGLLVYFVLFVWLWYINRARVFSSWDEFSHWGLVVKNMDFFDWFGNHPDSSVSFRGYPPAMALWQYFIGKLYGGFAESHVYQATGWFIAALCMPTISRLKWKDTLKAIFIVCFLLAVPMIFNASYIVLLYVDVILGILMGYVLYCGFYAEKKDCFYWINIVAVLCILSLAKASGYFLALATAVILIANEWINEEGRRNLKENINLLMCLVIPTASKLSWSFYLSQTETREAWDTSSMTLKSIINLFAGKREAYQSQTIFNFLNALGEKDFNSYTFNMHYMSWLVVCIILFYVLIKISKSKKQVLIYAVGSLIGLLIYTAGLMFLYIFTYSEYEAVNLASFQRYLSTYFVAMGYFIAGVLFTELHRKATFEKTGLLLAGGILFLFLPVNAIWDITILYSIPVNAAVSQRQKYVEILPYLEGLDYQRERVQYIVQNTSGFGYLNLRYLAAPIRSAGSGWSLGKPYSQNDMYTQDVSVKEWLDTLENQTADGNAYVYLYKIDDAFIEQYKDAFESEASIEQGSMYRLEMQGNKKYLKQVTLENK